PPLAARKLSGAGQSRKRLADIVGDRVVRRVDRIFAIDGLDAVVFRMVVINAEAPKPLVATRRRIEAEGASVDAVTGRGGWVIRRQGHRQLALNGRVNLALGQTEQVSRFQLAIVGPAIGEISQPRRRIEYGAREPGLLGLTSFLVIGVEEELVGVEAERA